MINKKINRLLSSILGVVLTVGVMEMPAMAVDRGEVRSNYNVAENINYTVNKDNSVEVNGLKIRINKIVASKHKLKVTVLVTSEKAFNEKDSNNTIVQLSYGENNHKTEGISYEKIDEKTLKISIERSTEEEEIPEKGELRVDLVMPKYKVNVGIDAKVDFTEAFENVIEKDLSIKMTEFNYTLKKVESSILGTTIEYSQPEKDVSEMKNDFINLPYSSMILKVGDKMYQLKSSGSASSSEEGIMNGSFEAEAATYDRVKEQKNMSIIPVACSMNWADLRKIYDENQSKEYNKTRDANKITTANVNYLKTFKFSDGTNGEIYNVVRNDNSLKVYCKGSSEIESLLMASNMFMYYSKEDDKLVHLGIFGDGSNLSFYKDPKESLGYVVEFNNVDKDKVVEVDFENMISQINKFKIGNEVEISK